MSEDIEYIPTAYFNLDQSGRIVKADVLDSKVLGFDGLHLNNRPLSDFIVPSDRRLFDIYCAETSRTKTRRSCRLRLLKNGNESLPVKIESRPMEGESSDSLLLRTAVMKIAASRPCQEPWGRNDEIYAMAFRKAGIGTWEWDIASGTLWWSEIAESIFGFFPGEFAGSYESFLDCVYPEDRHLVAEAVTSCIETGQDYCIEHRIVKCDGSLRWVLETGDVIRDSKGHVVRMAGIVQDITDQRIQRDETAKSKERLEHLVKERTEELMWANKALQEEVAERQETEKELLQNEMELKQLSVKLVDAQEDERKRVARELHDSIAGKLSAIKYGVEKKLGEMKGHTPSGGITLEDVLGQIKETIEETRRISRNLWPSQLEDLGLIASVDGLIRQFSNRYPDVKMSKEIKVEEARIPKRLKIVIYRLLQEALNNAGKYSGADRVSVSLIRRNNNLEFWVKDNGCGFDPEGGVFTRGNSAEGMGLDSMRERTEIAEGEFSVWSKTGEGTAIFATWRLDTGG